MNTKSKSCRLLVAGLSVLLVLAMDSVETVKAYEYVEDIETYEDQSDGYNRRTSTYIEYAYASANAEDLGDGAGAGDCDVSTHTWAENDTAVADSSADAAWHIDWTWDGPPGTAPGGTLSWYHWGFGHANAWGHNDEITDPNTQGAFSVANADSQTCALGTPGGLAYATINALGYVYDDERGQGAVSAEGEPEYPWTGPDPQTGYSWYDMSIDWDLEAEDEETIAEGTSYVYFSGHVDCDNYSAAAAGGTEAVAKTAASANVSVTADFDWP